MRRIGASLQGQMTFPGAARRSRVLRGISGLLTWGRGDVAPAPLLGWDVIEEWGMRPPTSSQRPPYAAARHAVAPATWQCRISTSTWDSVTVNHIRHPSEAQRQVLLFPLVVGSGMPRQPSKHDDLTPDHEDFVGLSEVARRLHLSIRTVTATIATSETANVPRPAP